MEDVHKCLTLHHAKLNGRRINVEKTCGGRNADVRAMRIKHIRNEQKIALSETVDSIMKEYEARGVFSMREINDKLMNRLYALTPELVREVIYYLFSLNFLLLVLVYFVLLSFKFVTFSNNFNLTFL